MAKKKKGEAKKEAMSVGDPRAVAVQVLPELLKKCSKSFEDGELISDHGSVGKSTNGKAETFSTAHDVTVKGVEVRTRFMVTVLAP